MSKILKNITFFIILFLVPSITFGFIIYLIFNISNIDFKIAKASENSLNNYDVNNIVLKETDILLNINSTIQMYKNSSAFASLQSALNFMEIKVGEKELIEQTSFYTEKPIFNNKNWIWGNPNNQFVGDVNGDLLNSVNKIDLQQSTSLGIYNDGLLKTAQKYRPDSFATKDVKMEEIISLLRKRNLILVWLANDKYYDQKEEFISGENTFTAFKFDVMLLTGISNNKTITTFYFLNTQNGSKLELDEETFYKYWYRLQNQILVVK